MKTNTVVAAGLAAALLTTLSLSAQQAVSAGIAPLPAMPKQTTRMRASMINRIVDVWLKDQPVYYRADQRRRLRARQDSSAATKADYITYEMEHGPLDFKELREFMRGLWKPARRAAATRPPAVIVTLPIAGHRPTPLRANAWMIQQALAAGVHGILLCNAESPEAARLMIEAAALSVRSARRGSRAGHAGNGSQALRVAHMGRDAPRNTCASPSPGR